MFNPMWIQAGIAAYGAVKGMKGGGSSKAGWGANLSALGPAITTILPGLVGKNMIGGVNVESPPGMEMGPSTYREGRLGQATENFLYDQVSTPGNESPLLEPSRRQIQTAVNKQVAPQLQRIRDNPDLSEGQKIDMEMRLRRQGQDQVAESMSNLILGLEARRTAGVFQFLRGEAMEEAERSRIIQAELSRITQFEMDKAGLEFRRDVASVNAFYGGLNTGTNMAGTLADIYSTWQAGRGGG